MHCLPSSMNGNSARGLHSWGKGEGLFFLVLHQLGECTHDFCTTTCIERYRYLRGDSAMARISTSIIDIETASASQAQHPMAFVLSFLQWQRFCKWTPLIRSTWASTHPIWTTASCETIRCTWASTHPVWSTASEGQWVVENRWCVDFILAIRSVFECVNPWLMASHGYFWSYKLHVLLLLRVCALMHLCASFTERRAFDRITKTYHFIIFRFHFRQRLHALAFFVFCLFITSKHTFSRNEHDVPLHCCSRMFRLKSPWNIFVFVRFKLPKCLVVCLFITFFSQSWVPVAHLVGICVPPQFLHRPNSLALCTGRSVFNQSATTIWMPLHPRMRVRTF